MEDLEKQYFDPEHEAGFTEAKNLISANKKKIAARRIKDWLTRHDTYTLHKPIRKKFPRLYYNVLGLDHVWEADLIVLSSLKNYNDNYSYLLVVIDVLSKYSFVEPLRDKTVKELTNAFKQILSRSKNRQPYMLQTDAGKEFVGKEFQKFLNETGIKFRVARNPDVKAAVVERFNRTLKERMFRYFTYKNTKRYIDVLQALVQSYNNSIHSTIKMRPAAVTIYNAEKARKNMLEKALKRQVIRKKPRYKVGQYVRISRERHIFEKGYEKGWSEEIFKIVKVKKRQNLFIYELCDLEGEDIEGFFYPEELSLVHSERVSREEYKINEILKTRGKGAKKEYFVSWVGYPDKFNSWILASEVKKL